eukprot:GEMP01027378.1.p1 GENE.GEMP01027378.1~~GEMP01027378.1.p1  ORF type:complete len:579 (+),score=164.65 GEMP01027378.1:38-1774(+)
MQVGALPHRGPCDWFSDNFADKSLGNGGKPAWTDNSSNGKGLRHGRTRAWASNPSDSNLLGKGLTNGSAHLWASNPLISNLEDKGLNVGRVNPFAINPTSNFEDKGMNFGRISPSIGGPTNGLIGAEAQLIPQVSWSPPPPYDVLSKSNSDLDLLDRGSATHCDPARISSSGLPNSGQNNASRAIMMPRTPLQCTEPLMHTPLSTHAPLQKSFSSSNELDKWKKKTQRLEQQIQKLNAESQAKQADNLELKDKIRKISGKNDHLTRQLREVKQSYDEQKVAAKYSENKFVRLQKKLRDFDGSHRDAMARQMEAYSEQSEEVDRLEGTIVEQKKMMDETYSGQEIEKLKTQLAASAKAHQSDLKERVEAETRSNLAEHTCTKLQKELEAAVQTIRSLQDAPQTATHQTDEVFALHATFQSLTSAHAEKEEEAHRLEDELRAQILAYQEELHMRCDGSTEKQVTFLQKQNELMKETLFVEIEQLRNNSGGEAQCHKCDLLALEKEKAESEKEMVESEMVTLRRLYDESVHKALGMQADMEEEIARNDALKIPWGFHLLPDAEKDFFMEAAHCLAVIPEEE